MIWSFLTAFPILVLSVAGLVHVVELGRLAVATEQASFFAARSELVDRDREVDLAEKSVLQISELVRGEDESSEHFSLRLNRNETSPAVSVLNVETESPNTRLLGNLLHLTGVDGDESFLPRPRLIGNTPLPKRPSSREDGEE